MFPPGRSLVKVAVDAGLRAGRTVAGNGPLVTLERRRLFDRETLEVVVTVSAPGWMGVSEVTLHGPGGWEDTLPLVQGRATWALPAETAWVLASVEGVVNAGGDAGATWIGERAWAVSGVGW